MTGPVAAYRKLMRCATVVRDEGGYDLRGGQANPVLFEEFVGFVLDFGFAPVVWEPFASPGGTPGVFELCDDIGVSVVAHGIGPSLPRVIDADSTVKGPGVEIGGMYVHPPYFGGVPFSDDGRELSLASSEVSYRAALGRTFVLGMDAMREGGVACAVGRRYRVMDEVRLDEWMAEDLADVGFELCGVMLSEPDVAIVARC
jgi:hypothetical protein